MVIHIHSCYFWIAFLRIFLDDLAAFALFLQYLALFFSLVELILNKFGQTDTL